MPLQGWLQMGGAVASVTSDKTSIKCTASRRTFLEVVLINTTHNTPPVLLQQLAFLFMTTEFERDLEIILQMS